MGNFWKFKLFLVHIFILQGLGYGLSCRADCLSCQPRFYNAWANQRDVSSQWDPNEDNIIFCNFNDNTKPFCDWTQRHGNTDEGEWIRAKYCTPTLGTGPDGDYPDGFGYYLYLEATNLIPNDRIILDSRPLAIHETICIDFWYHMDGPETENQLNVIVTGDHGMWLSNIWQTIGQQGPDWLYGSVTFTPATTDIQISFMAVRGLTEFGDIAIDNIRVKKGSCEKPTEAPTSTITIKPSSPITSKPTSAPVISGGTCSGYGDPHYFTFDDYPHTFMGNCTYTLTKLCDVNSGLQYFNVEVEHEYRGHSTRVSYVKEVTVYVHSYKISLGKQKLVKVNGVAQQLPLSLLPDVFIGFTGQYVAITAAFGLRVKYDGDHRVEVTVSEAYQNKVCGICANYNLNRKDDNLNPDGQKETDSVSYGNSWQVGSAASCTPASAVSPSCSQEEIDIIQSYESCAKMLPFDGVFQYCHTTVDPREYFANCFYDMCELHLDPDILCNHLQAYTDACHAAGAIVLPWRNSTFCPLDCPLNSHYEQCGTACPATCANPASPSSCSLPCTEGCICDAGYVLYENKCVPRDQCGCWDDGKHYPVGSEFWTDDSCSTKCTCPSAGSSLLCNSASCPPELSCGVEYGVPGCYRMVFGECTIYGDPHYNTFDKEVHHFMGTCTYTLTKLCNYSVSEQIPYFNVEAKNEYRGGTSVSWIKSVTVEAFGFKITMMKNEPSRVLVHDVWTNLPVTLIQENSDGHNYVHVSRSGRYMVAETSFYLKVSYDNDHTVSVMLINAFHNLTCGMCGNFNGIRHDDFLMPDGQLAQNSNQLGDSWKVEDDDPLCNTVTPTPPPPCPPENEALYGSDAYCGLIKNKDGPFQACIAAINPDRFFDSCVYDLCELGDDTLCKSLEAYADACQRAGAVVVWRNSSFCPIKCPANSHYNACADACPATCLSLNARYCNKPCTDGCECDHGFVLSGTTCVPVSECGCHYEGKYYQKNEMFWAGECEKYCHCVGNNQLNCVEQFCGPNEICKVEDGVKTCVPADMATCHIYGDPHYITFDGKLYHFQGSCNYTVVETCGNSSSVDFSITTRNEHRGNPTWTAINSVAVRFKNLHIILGKHRIVEINGAIITLPVNPIPGVSIRLSGSFVLLQTNFGLEVKFNGDHELFVKITEDFKEQLCGLCGTYNGNQLDDFLTPGGLLAPNSNDFGSSWRVPDNNWICEDDVVEPPTCDPALEIKYEDECRIILSGTGPFNSCHHLIQPQLYFENCVYDLCATDGNKDQFCDALEAYAAACESAGVTVGDWREDTICKLPTPTTPTSTTTTTTSPTTSPPSGPPGSCEVNGDPHYYTFDNQVHHFMGTCTYTLSKLCEDDGNLPIFNVEAANEHRGGNDRVSYVQFVNVDVHGHRITLEQNRVVRVNGNIVTLPEALVPGINIFLSGHDVVVTTAFGLNVKFDGNHRVVVTIPHGYANKVCGLCGNFNGNMTDDFLNPDGELEPDSNSLGNSWQVDNDTKCTPGPGLPPPCTDDEKVTISSNSFCGLITDKNGPFKDCHGVVDPLVYFNNCFYDLCELNLDPGALCDSLQSYAQSCQSNGVVIGPWRNETFCPLKCPQNSHFEPCGTACPATCVNPVSPSNCNLPCTESCICDPGYVLYNKECVPSLQCGCWENDKHYPVGSEFWTDDTCSTKCRCPSSGSSLICKSDSCRSDQYCSVTNGIPGCVYYSYGTCRVHNDPHYETFDSQTHHFMGLCTYTLSKLCTNSSLPYFNVEAKNVHRGNPSVSYVQRVLVDVYGYQIQIVNKEKSRILVDDVWKTLPVILNGGAIKVEMSGRYVVLETDFKLRVAYDTDHSVELKIPDAFSGQVCGMCGNYNNQRPDDFLMPNGQLAHNSNELGHSWIVYDKNDPSCTDQPPPPPPPTCPPEDESRYESDAFCGLLTSKDGLFSVCHAVVNPESFFESCVFDLCALNGGKDILCSALEAYADACQKQGITIPSWRNITSCGGKECPSNSEYKECMTACPATCLDPQAPEKCTSPCVEGCACKDGHILSGGVCVPKSQCGCWYNNQYYNRGDEFIEGNCERRCQCQDNNMVSCLPMSCPEDEICKVQNGLLGCYQQSTATCHIYGDPHYSTFDGTLHHFQGSCNYTASETCANTSHSFTVTTRNEHRGNPSWTAINSVALTVDGVHIHIAKNHIVHVNNVLVTLPTDVSGISIIRSGQYVVVNTNFGLQVKFNGDHELFVIVSEKYKDLLCGLCGTYNDNRLDDFTTPNGSIVTDVNDFGNSWRVPDDGWPCDPNPPIPPTCLPNIQQEAEAKCEIINQLNGPFAQCHALIPPYQYFESCVYDQCATGGNDDFFCSSLEFYAAACEAIGVILGDWRKEANCEIIKSTRPPKTTATTATTTTPTITPTTIGCDTVGTTTSTTPDKPTTTPKPIVTTTPGKCHIGCSFDSDFCNWKQSKSDNIDWIRWRGATPSDNTGPSFDHTTGDGYYLYIDGGQSNHGDMARLESPADCFTGHQCLRFWYHMYGFTDFMELNVAVLRKDGLEYITSMQGNQGNVWRLAEIFLPDSDIIQIFIEGKIGDDYRSDVAIDDISLTTGPCELPTPTSTPTSTTTTTTTSPTTSPPLGPPGSCEVNGDPHYYTFDNQVHHFMGTCTYTLSKLCEDDGNLPIFNVEAANEHRGGNDRVSYVQFVNVDVHGHRITLEQNRVVRVNGNIVTLPEALVPGINIFLSGHDVVVTTAFGLNVKFDGNHRVVVTIPHGYANKVCGLCGNFNGNMTDDFLNPDGELEPDSNSLGNSWQVDNDTKCTPGPGLPPPCTDDEKVTISSNSFCGLITDKNGPFKDCHGVVDPLVYFNNCFYDLCELNLDPGALCDSLQSYAQSCQSNGVVIGPWRNETFCPLKCPQNSHFEPCGTACPATCVNPVSPSNCNLPCTESCICHPQPISPIHL